MGRHGAAEATDWGKTHLVPELKPKELHEIAQHG